jgi:hypothetical protein
MYVCMCVCMYGCMYACMYVCKYVCMAHLDPEPCMRGSMNSRYHVAWPSFPEILQCISVCMYEANVCMYMNICMYVCMNVCMVCMSECTYVCMHGGAAMRTGSSLISSLLRRSGMSRPPVFTMYSDNFRGSPITYIHTNSHF